MMTRSELVARMAEAIAREEGFYAPGSTPAKRNNNPGDLRPWPKCPLPTSNGFIVFPSLEAGWEQLYAQIRLNIRRGLTLREFFAGKAGVYAGYAPAADSNRPHEYAELVGERIGIPVDVPLVEVARIESGAQREEH